MKGENIFLGALALVREFSGFQLTQHFSKHGPEESQLCSPSSSPSSFISALSYLVMSVIDYFTANEATGIGRLATVIDLPAKGVLSCKFHRGWCPLFLALPPPELFIYLLSK